MSKNNNKKSSINNNFNNNKKASFGEGSPIIKKTIGQEQFFNNRFKREDLNLKTFQNLKISPNNLKFFNYMRKTNPYNYGLLTNSNLKNKKKQAFKMNDNYNKTSYLVNNTSVDNQNMNFDQSMNFHENHLMTNPGSNYSKRTSNENLMKVNVDSSNNNLIIQDGNHYTNHNISNSNSINLNNNNNLNANLNNTPNKENISNHNSLNNNANYNEINNNIIDNSGHININHLHNNNSLINIKNNLANSNINDSKLSKQNSNSKQTENRKLDRMMTNKSNKHFDKRSFDRKTTIKTMMTKNELKTNSLNNNNGFLNGISKDVLSMTKEEKELLYNIGAGGIYRDFNFEKSNFIEKIYEKLSERNNTNLKEQTTEYCQKFLHYSSKEIEDLFTK